MQSSRVKKRKCLVSSWRNHTGFLYDLITVVNSLVLPPHYKAVRVCETSQFKGTTVLQSFQTGSSALFDHFNLPATAWKLGVVRRC